jgi:RNA polymerase sigma factor (sigma-70 family)
LGPWTGGHEEKWIEQEEESIRQLQLEKALGQLSDRQREIIYMKYYRQMDYDEIGTIMDLNYQSARNLVTRALTALRKEMTIGIIMLFLMT